MQHTGLIGSDTCFFCIFWLGGADTALSQLYSEDRGILLPAPHTVRFEGWVSGWDCRLQDPVSLLLPSVLALHVTTTMKTVDDTNPALNP